MACLCEGRWKSYLNGQFEGHVTVKPDCKTGWHEEKKVAVAVGCFDDGMTWDLLYGSLHFHYQGEFDGEKFGLPHEDHVTGTCIITAFAENLKDREKRYEEEWMGTKVT